MRMRVDTASDSAETIDDIDGLRARLAAASNRQDRVRLSIALSERLLKDDSAGAFHLAERALELAQALRYPFEIGIAQKQLGQCLLARGETARAYAALRQALRCFRELGLDQQVASLSLSVGEIRFNRKGYRKALEWFERALDSYRGIADVGGEGLAFRAIGRLFAEIKDEVKALTCFQEALSRFELLGDANATGVALSDVALVYGSLRDHDQALAYFTRSRHSFLEVGNHYMAVRALSNIARSQLLIGQIDDALESAERARAIYSELDEPESLAAVLDIIGLIHESRGDFERAVEHHRKGLDILTDVEDESLQAQALLRIGKLCHRMGDFHEARMALEEALHIARLRGDLRLQYQIHEWLAATLKGIGDAEQALRHHERFAEIREDVRGVEKQQCMAELQARFDVESARKQIEIMRLEKERLVAEKEVKVAELVTMKTMLEEYLRARLASIEASADHETRSVLRKLTPQLLDELRKEPAELGTWQSLLDVLDQRHPGFMRMLASRYPQLAPTERRVCAMTHLKMSTDEIARALGTQKKNIQQHRFRILKKMGGSRGLTLAEFLESLHS